MRIVEVRERTIPISRYADPAVPSGGLTTSAVAVITDVIRGGRPVIGYGFASIGRFAQGGLIASGSPPVCSPPGRPTSLTSLGPISTRFARGG